MPTAPFASGGVDPILVDGDPGATGTATVANPVLQKGARWKYLGQLDASFLSINTAALSVANQAVGTALLPVVVAGSTASAVIANTLITAGSMVFMQVKQGTTAPASTVDAGIVVKWTSNQAGTSFTIQIRNVGTTNSLGTDFELWYEIKG